MNRSSISRFIKNHERLQILIADLTDEVTDLAEAKLIIALRAGEPWAVKYWLDYKGQARGFGIRKLAFKDGEGKVMVPAVMVTNGRMGIEEWEKAYGNGGEPLEKPTVQ